MLIHYMPPDDFGNIPGGQLFRGQSQGFQNSQSGHSQNMGQGNSNQSNLNGQSAGNGQARRRGRGFASMDPQRVSEIASMGGKAAHAQGVAHEWSTEEARQAGRKGGQASRGNNRTQGGQTGSF